MVRFRFRLTRANPKAASDAGGGDRRVVRADVPGGQGVQAGDHNAQYNTFIENYFAQAAAVRTYVAGTVVVGEVPQEPVAFQPRAVLAEALRAGGPGVAVVRSVTGMRGVGKTQVAAAFARACIDAGWRLVAWVDAGDPAAVLTGLASVAVRLGIAESDADSGDAARAVRGWLEADGESCLVVFDNVTDLGGLRPLLPAAGQARVVITTTRQMAAGPGTVVPVGVFSSEEALAYLVGRTRLTDNGGAAAVAEEVGWLPLALAQAGAVIAAQRLSYGVYLERLRSVPVADYLVPSPGEPYPRGVAETVLLSLDAVATADPGGVCRAVMDVVSLLSPRGVSRALLYAAGQAGLLPGGGATVERIVDEALGQLVEGALLSFSGDGLSVSAHRLVMRVVRETDALAGSLEALGAGMCNLLNSAAASLGEPWRNPAAARDVIGQVTALHQHLAPSLTDGASWLAMQLLSPRGWALHFMNALGDAPSQAVEHGQALVADCERLLGPDHPDTLRSRNNLATAYQAAGQTEQAIPLFERNLASNERLVGPEHPDTLTSRNNLAVAYQAAGRRGQAITLIERNLADCERLLGPDHPETLRSRNNLAMAYRDGGRTAQAITLFERTLADRERLLGPDHPDTFRSRNNLAMAYQEVSPQENAITVLERNLADRERLLGPDHPDTLGSRNNLAMAYQAAGRIGQAITLIERNLADFERLLGRDHPDTLTSQNNLATAYQAAGRTGQAIALLKRNLADCERLLGPDHPDTLRSRSNLAMAYRDAGRTGQAIALLRRNLADRERLLGPDHPDTLGSRNNLAGAYEAAGWTGQAIALLRRTLADSERLLGADHPATNLVRGNLASLTNRPGRRRKRK